MFDFLKKTEQVYTPVGTKYFASQPLYILKIPTT